MKPETRDKIKLILANSSNPELAECFETFIRSFKNKNQSYKDSAETIKLQEGRLAYLEMRDRILIKLEMKSLDVRQMTDEEQSRMIRENHLFFNQTGLSSLSELPKVNINFKGTIVQSA